MATDLNFRQKHSTDSVIFSANFTHFGSMKEHSAGKVARGITFVLVVGLMKRSLRLWPCLVKQSQGFPSRSMPLMKSYQGSLRVSMTSQIFLSRSFILTSSR